ncbi:hypothetical protein ACROYT_G043856 [Oculina patagonica]
MGLAQYLAKFLPHLSDVTKPLRDLTQSNVVFAWNEAQQTAFEKLKEMVTRTPVLHYYNLKEEVTLLCDASQSGLGATLLQNGQPVAYASRALTPAETRYAQIEKELLEIVFACDRFDAYVYGRDLVNVETDHKPLEPIFIKPLAAAPKRLQRMLLRLQKFNLQVKYKKGKEMLLADTLSRAYLPEVNATEFSRELEDIDHRVWLPVTGDRWMNLSLKVSRLSFLQSEEELMEQTHATHIGIEGCICRARETLYWPRMTTEIKEHISKCDICLTHHAGQGKEPILQHKFIAQPWAKVAADLCEIDNRVLLVVSDYLSNFIEVARLSSLTSCAIIRELKAIFARFGVPDTLVTDNGSQFSSAECTVFAKTCSFEHKTSSPTYPQSNGKAEKAVQTVKNLFRKCKASGTSEFQALLDWRNTPTAGIGTSPAQRLMGRRCKTLLPVAGSLLQLSNRRR